jgi:hypothetical protein
MFEVLKVILTYLSFFSFASVESDSELVLVSSGSRPIRLELKYLSQWDNLNIHSKYVG